MGTLLDPNDLSCFMIVSCTVHEFPYAINVKGSLHKGMGGRMKFIMKHEGAGLALGLGSFAHSKPSVGCR